jgi:predicted SnoaL-like aldol condensation-catalyzing enzyme
MSFSVASSSSDATVSSFVDCESDIYRGASDTETAMHIALTTALAGAVLLVAIDPTFGADLNANKQLIRDYIENVINKHRPDAADNYFAADYTEHNPRLPPGLAGKKKFIASLAAGFSDYHGEIQQILGEGDEVVTRTRWTGTQDGPDLGRAATGNKLDFTTADFYRIEKGRVVEHWDVVDTLARAVALGLVQPPK